MKNGRRNTYWVDAIENANVLTASIRPRTRNAPAPMTAATSAVNSVASRIDTTKGTPAASMSIKRTLRQPMSSSTPRVKAAPDSAPMPANAICDSDS